MNVVADALAATKKAVPATGKGLAGGVSPA